MIRWNPLRPLSAWSALPLASLCTLLLVTAFVLSPWGWVFHGPRLPRAATAEALHPRGLILGIDEDARFRVGIRRVTPAELEQALRDSLARRPAVDRQVELAADRDVGYGEVLFVLEAASRAGVREMALMADCPRGREGHWRRCAAEPAGSR